MPITELAEIKDFKEYQKILKKDLESAKTKRQPFFYVESFKFTGKTGPALVFGKLPPTLVQAFKANGTASTFVRGKCQFVKAAPQFMIDEGELLPQKLKTALSFGKLQVPKFEVTEPSVDSRSEDVQELQAAVDTAAKRDLKELRDGISRRFADVKNMLSRTTLAELTELGRKYQAAANEDLLTAYEPLAELEEALALAEAGQGLVVERPHITPDAATVEAFRAYAEAAEALNQVVDRGLVRARPRPGKLAIDPSVSATHEVEGDSGVETVTQRSVKQALEDRVDAEKFRTRQVEDGKIGAEKLAAVKILVKSRRTELTSALQGPKGEIETARTRIEELAKVVRAAQREIVDAQKTIDDFDTDCKRVRENDNLDEEKKRQRLLGIEQERDEARETIRTETESIRLATEEVDLLERKVEAQKQLARDEITRSRDALRDDIERDFPGFQDQFPTVVPKLEEVLADTEKGIPDADDAVRDFGVLANRHGTGRHGAQTGIEHQARRVATGGSTADQPGNEYGTSRGASVRWNAVTIEWEDGDDGTRVVKDKKSVLKEVLRQKETRVSAASASSMFHSPELEKEAVERAIDIANNQIVWTEEHDGNDWKPLQRVALVIGPPRVSRSVGWGLSQKQKDTNKKLTLEEANAVLERFRNGDIGVDAMLDELNAALVLDTGGGAKMMRNAKLILDRLSTGWTTTTHYPCEDAPGWSLKDKRVRKSSVDAEETAGDVVNP